MTEREVRRYDSSGRQARMAESRRRIVGAAHDLFVSGGYAGTSVAAIAKAAQVSTPTVYTGFSGKAELLKAAIDVALAGDDEPIPIVGRSLSVWVYQAVTAEQLVARYAVMMGELAARAAPIFEVLANAADSDPDLKALLDDLERQRLTAAMMLAKAIAERGGLPPGRSVEEARDLIWVCNDPRNYTMLSARRRWSNRRYVGWARETLLRLVIAPVSPPIDLGDPPPAT